MDRYGLEPFDIDELLALSSGDEDDTWLASADYACFTLPRSAEGVCAYVVGLFEGVRESAGRGLLGYAYSERLPEGGRIAYGGNNDTLFVSLPGRCLGWLAGRGVDIPELVRDVIEAGGHFTRCDVAFDDRSGAFSVADFVEALENDEVVSKYRRFHQVQGLRGDRGHTVYCGSSASDSMVRVYDKGAEQDDSTGRPWVRVEGQFRRAVAQAVARIVAGLEEGSVGAVLRSYLDWRIPAGDSNKSRWQVRECWASLLGADRQGLGLPGEARTIGKAVNWALEQWAVTASALQQAFGERGFAEFLGQVLGSANEDKVSSRLLSWGVRALEGGCRYGVVI